MSNIYTVQPGETLQSIAAHWPGNSKITWKSIADANHISSPYTVRAGQRLVIPYYSSGTSSSVPVPVVGSSSSPADFSGMIGLIINGTILYGIFRVLMKVF